MGIHSLRSYLARMKSSSALTKFQTRITTRSKSYQSPILKI